jgi:hypothetical protein
MAIEFVPTSSNYPDAASVLEQYRVNRLKTKPISKSDLDNLTELFDRLNGKQAMAIVIQIEQFRANRRATARRGVQ